MFSPNTLQNYHFLDKYQILENKHFWTNVTLGSCINLGFEKMWKKFQKFTM